MTETQTTLKANELRIGNLVSNGYKYYIVNENMIYDIVAFNAQLEPIPLTPEILEKAGYKDLKNVFFIEGNIYWNEIKLPHIKNLHQLQNLFFCLTGEELNVNL